MKDYDPRQLQSPGKGDSNQRGPQYKGLGGLTM
jgi:hypothetical protein